MQNLFAVDHDADTRMPTSMTGDRAERFVVLSLWMLAATFAAVGLLFLFAPDGTLSVLTDLGDWLPLGSFTAAPETQEQLWLSLGFAYMTVITGICVVVATDVVRYRPLLLVLAAGKAASSLTSLAFYLFDTDVFAYLLNFLVDGSLVGVSLLLYAVAGRVGEPAAPS
jgi:hypothetical protein